MSVEHSLLGKDTHYPTAYQPDILFPIARATAREQYAHVEGICQGKDWWHVFEISWLNASGVPQVAYFVSFLLAAITICINLNS